MAVRQAWLTPQRRIVGGAVAIGLAATAWIANGLVQDRAQVEKSASGRTLNRAMITGQYTRESIRRVEQALGHTADEFMRASAAGRANPADLRHSLEAFVARGGLIHRMAILDKTGKPVLATGAEADFPASLATQEVFTRQRDGATGKLVFSTPYRTADGKTRLLPASMRLAAPDGAFAGIVLAEINTAHFAAAFEVLGKEPGGFYTLFLRSGAIIARLPDDAAVLDRNWADSPMFREHLPGASRKTVRQVVAASGIESLYSYDSLTDFPVVTASGLSLTGVLAPWRERVQRDLALLAGGLLVLALGTWLVLRSLRSEVSANAAQAESEERYRRLFDTATLPMFVHVEGILRMVNPAAVTMFGVHDADELIGRSGLEFIHPEDRPTAAARGRAAADRRQPQAAQLLRYVRVDGTQIEVEVTSEPFEFKGEPAALTTARDITQEMIARRRVARVNQLYAALSQVNQAVVHSGDYLSLCEQVSRIAVEIGGMGCALVRRFDAERGLLIPVYFHGPATGLIGRHELPLEGTTGVSVEAVKGNGRCIVHDMATSPITVHAPGAREHGLNSAAAFVLKVEGKLIGTFAVFGPGNGFFDDEMVALLQEIADSLAYAQTKLEAELVLRERERDLQRAQAAGRIGSVIVDLQRGEWYLSPVGNEIAGLSSASWRPITDFAGLLAPDTREASAARMRANVASGMRTSEDYEIIRPTSGERAWIRVITESELAVDGTALRRIGTIQDITAERSTRLALARSDERFKLAIAASNVAIWDWNIATGVSYLSDEYLRLFGYEPGEATGDLGLMILLVHPDERKRTLKSLFRQWSTGIAVTDYEQRFVCKDGSIKWVQIKADIVERDAAGRALRMVGTAGDLTARKTYEERILRLSRLYNAISKTNDAVIRQVDFTDVCAAACRIVVEEGGLVSATIRRHDRDTDTLIRVALHGPVGGMVGRELVSVDDPRGVAPAAFRAAAPVIVRDLAADPLTQHAHGDGAAQGIGATACFPLMERGEPFGTFTVFAASSATLDEQTVKLLAEIAESLAFARAKFAADAALAASERDLAQAQSAGRIGSIMIEFDDGTWTTSGTGCEILGLDRPKARTHGDFEDMLSAQGRDQAVNTWRTGLVSNARTDDTYSLGEAADGKRRWVRMISSVEFGADGQPQRRIGIVQDVTAQVAAEQRITRLSSMYATLSKTNEAAARAPDFPRLCEAVCNITTQAGAFASAAVRLHDPLRNVLRLQATESAPDALRALAEIPVDSQTSMVATAFRDGQRLVIRELGAHPASRGIAAEAKAHGVHAGAVFPLKVEGRQVGTFTVFAYDGAEFDDQAMELLQEVSASLEFSFAKHESDAARRDSDARMAAVIGSAMDAIITCDENMRIVLFNEAASTMFRCPASDALGAPLDRFLPQRFRAGHTASMRAFAAGESSSRGMGRAGDVVALRADGQEFPAEASISHTDVAGRKIYTVIMRDITERLAAERRIDRLTRLYAALSSTNEAIVRGRDWKALCDEVCRIIVEQGGVASAALRMPNPAGTVLEVVAGHGPRAGAIGERAIPIVDDGTSIAVPVFRDGKVAVVNDFATHPVASGWAADARPLNVNAAVVLPLRSGDAIVGVLSVYASERGHFDGELAALMGDLADNLGFAHAKLANERAVAESEERFRALTMMASDWYWETDREHRFTRMSQGLQNDDGSFDAASVIGKTRWDFDLMVMDQKAMQAHRDALDRRAPFRDFEYHRVGPDGKLTIRSISGEPVFDQEGRFTGYRGVGRNVTRQRLAEEDLRASEERYRTLVDASPDAIRVVSDGRVVMVNPACVRLYGATSQTDIIGRDPLEFIKPEHHARATQRLRRVIEDGAIASPIETSYVRPDGSTVEVETVTLPYRFNDRPAALSIIRDLTERNASQRALTEAERRYRSLVEASQGGVLLLAGDVVAYANPGMQAMLGFARLEDIPGTSLYSLVTLESHESIRAQLRRLSAHANQTMPQQDLRMRRRNGETIDITATAASIDLDGQTMIQMELRDVTRERLALAQVRALNETLEARIAERTRELTQSNHDLEAANRDLESFSYSVAHDLRAPLRSMAGFASLLEMDVATGALDELPKHTARITQNAARMNALIDGLLAVSRVTHGELKDEAVDFARLTAEVISEAGPAANVRITVDPLPVMRGDTSALRQVWANLVSNALKYSARRAAPQVQIGAELRESEYVFHVRDNGAGFDPAYSQRLFGVFSRLHSSNEFVGTGVGLAVVRRVVERHGGHVWAEGRPDQGATFYFTLPAARNIARPS